MGWNWHETYLVLLPNEIRPYLGRTFTSVPSGIVKVQKHSLGGHLLKSDFELWQVRINNCISFFSILIDCTDNSPGNPKAWSACTCPWVHAAKCYCWSGGSGTHFTNDFSITIQIWWKFHLALIQLLVIISQQNLAHATTAQLSCHVPNIVAITLLVLGWEQNEISITFELWWKNC